jgi:hypothetical protein
MISLVIRAKTRTPLKKSLLNDRCSIEAPLDRLSPLLPPTEVAWAAFQADPRDDLAVIV